MKHTPGPWHYDDQLYIWGPKGEMVFTMNDGSDGPADMIGMVRGFGANLPQDANAALIAAAPELLAALIDAVDSLEYVNHAHPEATGGWVREVRIAAARAAITKATGE